MRMRFRSTIREVARRLGVPIRAGVSPDPVEV
jgi:hypothetical protein